VDQSGKICGQQLNGLRIIDFAPKPALRRILPDCTPDREPLDDIDTRNRQEAGDQFLMRR
jgi:hypothetical protein